MIDIILEVAWFYEVHHGEEWWPDDVANILGLPVNDVLEACDVLVSVGKLH